MTIPVKLMKRHKNWLIFIPKICIFRFMNQAHEPQMGKLREMWFGGHQKGSQQSSSKDSKVDTWLGVVQSALGALILVVAQPNH